MFEAMNEFGVDTLKAARALEEAGFETRQAETLVTVFRSFAVGDAATRSQLRDFEQGMKTEIAGLRAGIEGLRSETKTEIEGLRTELKTEIEGLRVELKTEIEGLRSEMKTEIEGLRVEMKTEIEGLRSEMKTEIEGLRVEFMEKIADIQLTVAGLRTRMYQLMLAQTVVIVGLIVSLDRLL